MRRSLKRRPTFKHWESISASFLLALRADLLMRQLGIERLAVFVAVVAPNISAAHDLPFVVAVGV